MAYSDTSSYPFSHLLPVLSLQCPLSFSILDLLSWHLFPFQLLQLFRDTLPAVLLLSRSCSSLIFSPLSFTELLISSYMMVQSVHLPHASQFSPSQSLSPLYILHRYLGLLMGVSFLYHEFSMHSELKYFL